MPMIGEMPRRGAVSTNLGGTMGGIEKEYKSALAANEKRYAQAMAIYDEIITRYQPGGTFGKAALGQLEERKERDVGTETQAQISGGLFGTTAQAGLGTKWEAEVGAPARLKLEDIMMERLSQAQLGKAGFIERREDVYPDVGAAAGYASQGGAGGGGQTISGSADISGYMRMFNESRGGTAGTTGGGGTTGGWSGGGASRTLTFGPAGGGQAHQATPGYGLGEESTGTVLGVSKEEQAAHAKARAASYSRAMRPGNV